MTESNQRRSADELLGAIQNSRVEGHGRLRVFLGMCPGVGKTYAMLEAAKLQAARGFQVLAGVVETHGRKETQAVLDGLDILPPCQIEYKGTQIFELDLDQILKKRPQIVLVDELAHTNAPGSRHIKRYQDVIEILEAGIDVFTTVNIQHIESRNDQVAQITGVIVRETVPDSFFELADQIEVIDIPPTELLQRLSEGKVYLGDRAVRAREGFFREEHLMALRELALRFVAEQVDQDLANQMTIKGIAGPWNTSERLLVAVSFSPYSARLIRTTRRMAKNFEAPWIALYVDTGESLRAEDERNLQRNIQLARELGAEVITLQDDDIARAIQKVSHDRNVTQIIMGRPDRRFFHDLFAQGSLLDKLVRDTSKVDVHVIRAERKATYRRFAFRMPPFRSGLFAYYNTAWFLAFVSFICRALLPLLGYQALGSIFLLSILVVAGFTSGGPILFAAVMSALIWDYFFIPPTWTFSITSPVDAMIVISFFVAAIVGGLLTARIKRQEAALELRESESRRLYELVRNLSAAADPTQATTVLCETIRRQLAADASVLLTNRRSHLEMKSVYTRVGKVQPDGVVSDREQAVAQWSFENSRPAGWGTPTLSASRSRCLPMRGESSIVGVLVFVPPPSMKALSIETENFLETVVAQASIVLERMEFREAVESTKLYEASEKLHQTLLNSVSHELRTPITALIGTSTALQDEKTIESVPARQALTNEIVRAAKRLDRVVENLLDVSRLQKGTMQIKREWFDLDELLNTTLLDLKDELSKRKVLVSNASTILLEGDFQLLQHSLTQLILNAVKYASKGTSGDELDGARTQTSSSEPLIEIQVETLAERVRIHVLDSGPGLPMGELSNLFEKFHRLPGTRAGGIGLGLSIVKAIVELHDGRSFAQNRLDKKGADFVMELPMKKAPSLLTETLA